MVTNNHIVIWTNIKFYKLKWSITDGIFSDASGEAWKFPWAHLSVDKSFNFADWLEIFVKWGIFGDAGPYYLGVILTIFGIFQANYFYYF